ncbi:MAG: DinB family protein [Nitrospinota bacterium]
MRIVDSLLIEFEREAETTKRFLSQVPTEKLSWKPTEKSLSLGQIAFHIATIPKITATVASAETFEVPKFDTFPTVESADELLPMLEKSVSEAKEILNRFENEEIMKLWILTKGGNEIASMPRVAVIRSVMLNHWYHHRGQLSIYLRMLGCFVPASYGPSADEDPYA